MYEKAAHCRRRVRRPERAEGRLPADRRADRARRAPTAKPGRPKKYQRLFVKAAVLFILFFGKNGFQAAFFFEFETGAHDAFAGGF